MRSRMRRLIEEKIGGGISPSGWKVRIPPRGGRERTLSRGHPWVLLAAHGPDLYRPLHWIATAVCVSGKHEAQDLAATARPSGTPPMDGPPAKRPLYRGTQSFLPSHCPLRSPRAASPAASSLFSFSTTLILGPGGISLSSWQGPSGLAAMGAGWSPLLPRFPGLHYVNLMACRSSFRSPPSLLPFWRGAIWSDSLAALMVISLTTEPDRPGDCHIWSPFPG